MTRRGDIANSAYAERAKEYCWSKVSSVLPRGISPTDVDAAVEVNSCFLFVEGKTQGSTMPKGQQMFFRRLMLRLPERTAAVLIAQHERLDTVDASADFTGLQLGWNVGGQMQWSSRLSGTLIGSVFKQFGADAETGTLHPEEWAFLAAATQEGGAEGTKGWTCDEPAAGPNGYCPICDPETF